MAAWQVDFYIVPQRAFATAPQPLTPAVLNGTEWWTNASFPTDFRDRLSAVVAAGRPLDADHEVWGQEDGNRVDVVSEKGRVSRVTARVDVRRLDSRFGAALLLFVRSIGAVLIRADGLVLEPTIAAFAGALRNSSAWRFANDPAALLRRAASDDEDGDDDD